MCKIPGSLKSVTFVTLVGFRVIQGEINAPGEGNSKYIIGRLLSPQNYDFLLMRYCLPGLKLAGDSRDKESQQLPYVVFR